MQQPAEGGMTIRVYVIRPDGSEVTIKPTTRVAVGWHFRQRTEGGGHGTTATDESASTAP
jgi:hypothetical protein